MRFRFGKIEILVECEVNNLNELLSSTIIFSVPRTVMHVENAMKTCMGTFSEDNNQRNHDSSSAHAGKSFKKYV